jgi:outer membrane protein, multidrug efflux system
MMQIQKSKNLLALTLMSALLSACAVGPTYSPPVSTIENRWYAPLPHGGSAVKLSEFWAQWNDAALSSLIDSAQKNGASVEQAAARIAQARANAAIAGASVLPGVDANASVTRGNQGMGVSTTSFGSVQAAWELDLFGANRRGRESAAARLEARGFDWHDARVSVAAEVATVYTALRINQLLLGGFERDAQSRSETARLTTLKSNAGFEAPANAALADAAKAEANTRVVSQRTEIDLGVKSLVALTGLSESDVRTLVTPTGKLLSPPTSMSITQIPAQVLSQRPDLASIERELAASIADIGAAEADRYPRISLTGNVGYSASRAFGMTSDGATWGFGPSITIPLFDAGRRSANVDLAKARHAEQIANYKATATRAVREVEEALTRIDSARTREADQQASLVGYEVFAKAADARLKAGVGSVLELEDARRAVLGAQVNVLSLERERAHAWISLYRAAGGGWTK